MTIYWIILIIIAVYFLIVFVGLRLVVPFMGFTKPKLPEIIPEEIKNKILELESASTNQMEYLQGAYAFIAFRWQAGRMNTVFYAPLAFRKNLLSIWNRSGYAHCNTQNYLLYVLLAGSKFFKPEDITFHCIFFNFFIHQYITVKVADAWVAADPAGATIRNAPLGTHIKYFG